MQLAVVLLVLPPLLVLSRAPLYRTGRIAAALVIAVAAVGWLLDRIGMPTAQGRAADNLGGASPWIAGALWIAAAAVLIRARGSLPGPTEGTDTTTVRLQRWQRHLPSPMSSTSSQ